VKGVDQKQELKKDMVKYETFNHASQLSRISICLGEKYPGLGNVSLDHLCLVWKEHHPFRKGMEWKPQTRNVLRGKTQMVGWVQGPK